MKLERSLSLLMTLALVLTNCRDRGDDKPNTPQNQAPAEKKDPEDFDLGKVNHAEDFAKGNTNALITIEYFADLQCGACKKMSPILDELMASYPGKLRLIFKNYPKDKSCMEYSGAYLHEYSCEAAYAARCVGYIGRFWQYKDQVFKFQDSMNLDNLKKWATELGLSSSDYDTCVAEPKVKDKVVKDINEANSRGVTGTPTIFVNKVKIFPATKEAVEAEIKKHL